MMTFQFALEGGPHHREAGWFHTPDGDIPTALYVGVNDHGTALVVADPNSPFAAGPLTLYRRTTEAGTDTHRYRYEKEH
jgi:hypothetical protein